jgi:hypothetical protein
MKCATPAVLVLVLSNFAMSGGAQQKSPFAHGDRANVIAALRT